MRCYFGGVARVVKPFPSGRPARYEPDTCGAGWLSPRSAIVTSSGSSESHIPDPDIRVTAILRRTSLASEEVGRITCSSSPALRALPSTQARLVCPGCHTQGVNMAPAESVRELSPLTSQRALDVVGLFAGIGGIELGLHQAGHRSVMLCEKDEAAKAVLRAQFGSGTPLESDINSMAALPSCDVVAAGFPCQDLSQAGRTAGISGDQSGLVAKVFDLVQHAPEPPPWLLLENVPFMLRLGRGAGMRYLVDRIEHLGYRWAYRIVDSRAFGLPQRRRRAVLLASRDDDPGRVLLGDDAGVPPELDPQGRACGFYWTEGTRGLGWAVDAVPTLKGGSTIGIPSPPAIWMPDGAIVTPDIRDVERMQGFLPDWTSPGADGVGARNARWKLVGNAVSVPVARWIGEKLKMPSSFDRDLGCPLRPGTSWPDAACGSNGKAWSVSVSAWPRLDPCVPLAEFLRYEPKPLSKRAATGFFRRASTSTLHFPEGLLDAVSQHISCLDGGEPVGVN